MTLMTLNNVETSKIAKAKANAIAIVLSKLLTNKSLLP